MRKQDNNTMLLLLCLFGFSVSFAQIGQLVPDEEVQAKIKIVREDNLVNIYATATNNSEIFQDQLKYSILSLKKSSTGNLSKNVQSGFFSLFPEESKTLSTQQVNLEPESEIQLFLYIKRDSMLISRDTLTIENISESNFQKTETHSDFEWPGLILDQVMTKTGRDFYERLNSLYRLNGINFPMMMIVEEKPLLGGINSEIKVWVDDHIIFQFNSQPDEDFLELAVQAAYRKLLQYHKERQKLLKQERKF
jgi:hypothetical protein